MLSRTKERLHWLLRWSEQYTKTDMVYLARGGFWYGLGTVAIILISFCTALAFANLLPRETYGTYQYVLTVADIFGIFVLSGIDTALARSVARGMEGSLWEGLRAKIRWGLVGGAGSLALGCYYFAFHNTTLGWAFAIAGVLIPFWEAPGFYTTYLQGKKQFNLSGLYDVGVQFWASIFTVGALFFSKNLLVILTVYLVSWGVARTFFLWRAIRREPPNTVRDPAMVRYGKHLTAMGVINTFASSFDDIVLWHFLGPAAVAVYTFAQGLPVRGAGVIKIVNRIAFPKFATTEHEVLKQTLSRKVWGLFGVAILCAFAYIALAPFLFWLLFPKYMDAVRYTQVLAALIALQPFNLFSSALSAQAKTKALYIYNFAVPGVRIALILFLVPTIGIWGAVFAYVITDVFDSAISMGLFYWS